MAAAKEVQFERELDPTRTEYTVGTDDDFWSFDFVISEDGNYMKMAVAFFMGGEMFMASMKMFPMALAYRAAAEAVKAGIINLIANKIMFDEQKEHDWITDTFLRDVQEHVDLWRAKLLKEEGRLN